MTRTTRRMLSILMAAIMLFALVACGGDDTDNQNGGENNINATGVEDGVLTVGMECQYAPYNWTQMTDENGAVAIANNPGSYANGYDVMMAKKICEANGWDLEIMAIDWGGLIPALESGQIDMVIAGQSMTEERMAQVDMAGPYFYASIVCVTKADSPLAKAKGISELTGTCTAQSGTIWYDSCLGQIEGADIQAASETAPAMIMAVESGTVDFICTDVPTAMGAVATYPDLTILNFTGQDDNFVVDEGEINIGISVAKGNTALFDAANDVLRTMTVDDFESVMNDALAVQPEI
ncbi:MAG: transporter substrate-binding domain-containing protein [Firmicutes bacterium]|nr:transporter substrate-binding domain-containing protein [Bacillota bacterium]